MEPKWDVELDIVSFVFWGYLFLFMKAAWEMAMFSYKLFPPYLGKNPEDVVRRYSQKVKNPPDEVSLSSHTQPCPIQGGEYRKNGQGDRGCFHTR